MEIWSQLGFSVVAILTGVVTAGLAVLIGGVGGLAHVVRRINLLEQRVDDTDGRITKEVKTRAGLAAVAAKAESRSAKQIAEEHLANSPGDSGDRPKVSNFLRR